MRDMRVGVVGLGWAAGAHIEAFKHVLPEQPIALSWDDAKAVRDAVRKAKVQACVCFEVRFSSQFQMVRRVVEQGLLGDIHYAEVDYYHGIGPWYGQFPWNVTKDGGGSSLLSEIGRASCRERV